MLLHIQLAMLCCEDGTLSSLEVPEDFRDIAILSGYRRPGSSFTTCVRSLFKLHNETFNVWTHLISSSFYVYFLLDQSSGLLQSDDYTILCLLVTCCLFPFGSAIAHLFNCMSPVARHVCFMIDYLSISLYAFGACCANKVYALPRSWQGGQFDNLFLICMFVSCVGCVFVSCQTRFMPVCRKTKILRLGAFALPYFLGMTPCMYRVLYCDIDNSCPGASYYSQHFFDTIFTVTFYGGHIPEIFFPGCFDIFFQSHSIFHVVVVVGTFHHAQGVIVDRSTRNAVDHAPMGLSPLLPLKPLNQIWSLYCSRLVP